MPEIEESAAAANPPGRFMTHPELQPAPEPTSEPVAPVEADNPPPPPQKVFVAGREQTVEEALRNYEASSYESLRLKSELDAAATRERMLLERIAPQAPAAPAPPPDFRDASPQEIASYIDRIATEKADARARASEAQMQSFIGGLQGLQQANATMKQADPTYDGEQLVGFLNNHPDVRKVYDSIFSHDQVAALDYAWTKAKGNGAGSAGASRGDANGARAVGTPPKQRVATAPAAGSQADLAKALERAQNDGNWQAYYALRAKGTSIDRMNEFQR